MTMRLRTRFRISILTLFVVIICCISDDNFIDPFDTQPKIVVKNGHLEFETAKNRNITFKSSGSGVISINGEDLAKIVQSSKTAVNEVQRISSLQIADMSRNLSQLQLQYSNIANNILEIRASNTVFNDSYNKLNLILGSRSNSMSPIAVRRAIRKVNRIDQRLNQLITLLEKDECESNPCRNGGTCVDAYNGFHCRCTDNWQGTNCDTDVNECFMFVGTDLGCQNGGTCINTPGGYSCRCPPNKYGIHCTEQYDDCFSASNEDLCAHGTCVNLPRSVAGQAKYRCMCNQGWTNRADGPACDQDVDECSSLTPHCSVNPMVTCINTAGGFHCGACPHGYTGNGFSCYDINECEINNGGCSQYPRVQCTNTIGSRICGPCPPGYQGNGMYCNFVGTCHINNGGCHPLAQCLENTAISAGFRECRCPNGYIGNGVGQSGCIPQSGTTCSNNPCSHGSCVPHGNSFNCICSLGFTGHLCDIEINECLSNPCRNGGTCTDQQNGFLCACTDDYEGLTCETQRETCGGYFNTEFGSIRYPLNRNTNNPNRISCIWRITTTHGKVLVVTFRSFNSGDCSNEYLQINDGPNDNSPRIGRLCGNSLPTPLTTNTNHAYLWFKSDHSQTNSGFELYWNTTDPVCGSELNVTEFGSVNSPGYPNQYPHDRDCYWLVRVPLGKRITFHFAKLALENHTTCNFDYLEVFDGQRQTDPSLGKYCSTITPPPITTSGSYARFHFHTDSSLSDIGFHITYSSIPGIPGCGGFITAPKATIASPNFPEQYSNNVECDWLIRTHPNERIQITFTLFDLESQSSCGWDYLEVRDGENGESPLIGRFCGNTIPQTIISTGNKVWAKFHADSSFTGQGFRAQYVTICGGLYTDLEGTIRSPYFPDPYPSDRQCLYHIVVPQSNVIRLTFDSFDIQGSIDCNFDYLEINDGFANGTQLMHLCGSNIPDAVTSRYNEMLIKFVTDASENNLGFSANYTTIEVGCGGVFTTNHGSVATPNHPNFYPHAANCFWLLNAPIGYIVRLTFTVFALELHPSCRYDYVEVRDTNNQVIIRKFCGQTLPPVLTSTGNQMFVEFKSDSNLAHEGFAAAYSFLDATTSCGGNFFLDSGVIRSPGYPSVNYPSHRDCIWVLEAQNGRQFSLNVTHFELESGSNCRYDYLEIRNGRESSSPLIGKFCGTRILQRIQSHGPFIYLRFKTDSYGHYSGFEITYNSLTTGCGGTLTSQSGSIESPGYPQAYAHNAECFWKIVVSRGSSILLTIIDIDIEAQSQCLFDYLQIFDGASDRSKSLGRYCTNTANPHHIVSRDNVMFLKFRTDHTESGRGFRLNYRINCSNTVTGYRGVIESPNYPENYGNNANCTWTIKAPRGNNITIAFYALVIEDYVNCTYDRVSVSELMVEEQPQRVQELKVYCGTFPNDNPPILNTSSNIAYINFVTDQSVSHMGFQLEWVSVGCGGEFYNKMYGEITSPNYPNGYPHNTDCLWHIVMPPGTAIKLTIQDFDLETHMDCSFDFVKIFGGIDETSPLHQTICQRISSPRIVTSTGSAMTILFSSDISVRGRGFKASFEQKSGCGGIYTADSFTIMSPNYPHQYDTTDDCIYSIEVNGLHDIEFTFDAFGMPSSDNCSESYLAIYDGVSKESPLILQHCGSSVPPNIVRTTSNKAYLRMKADGSQSGQGFSLTYKAVCGGTKVIESSETGDIRSPNYPHLPVDNQVCHWILKASNLDGHITLRFTHIDSHKVDDCETQYVEVRDGDDSDAPVILKYCGTALPLPITSQGSAMYISSLQTIFRASFATTLSECGGDLIAEEGFFASPGYPNSYPIDIECIWTIRASPGNRVTFNFIEFNIEQSDFCNTDYVELRENDRNGAYLNRYCGNQIPILNSTSSNVLWVKFRTDDQGTGDGFRAYYRLQHGIDLVDDYGRITSPGYPLEYTHKQDEGSFTWTIIVSRYKFVSITFEDLSIPVYNDMCNSYVQIMDGIGESATEIGRYCGFEKPNPVVGTTNSLTVRYVPQYSSGKFSLIYAAINGTVAAILSPRNNAIAQSSNTSFEVTLNRTATYQIRSPGYPTGYANNLDYNWIIHCLPSYHFKVNVIDLLMEGHNSSCWYDWYDTLRFLVPEHPRSLIWRINKTLCGRFVGTFELPRINLLRINFKTNSYYNRTGFDLIVSTVCGGIIRDSSGMLSTEDVMSSTHCEWTIIVRDGRTINITFEEFTIADNSHCQYSYMILRNGQRNDSSYLGGGRYCGSDLPAVPVSSSNAVYITFHAYYTLHAQFRLRFKEVSVGCNDYLTISETTPSVEIMSPNYPQLPPHDMQCVWTIRGPIESSLRLEFEIPVNPTWHCNITSEFVEIRDGGTEISRLIVPRLCVPPRGIGTIKSTGNLMRVRFDTSGRDNLSNFKAKIELNDCGATFFVHGSLRLTLPSYPTNYTSNLNCDFYLKTYSESYYYQLNISSLDMPAENNDCNRGDSIEIREPDSTGYFIGKYCGYNSNILVNSTKSTVLITFKSNSDQYTGKGFVIYATIAYSRCGGIIENAAITGQITSPNFPNAVPSYRDCTWHLFAPPGRRIQVTFLDYNLKANPRNLTTCLDYLRIYKSVSVRSTLIDMPCNSVVPNPIETQSHYMTIYFRTNSLSANEGFRLQYSAENEEECGGSLSESSGTIISYRFGDLNYTDSMDCTWDINFRNGGNNTVAFSFDVFEIPKSRTSLCYPSVFKITYLNPRYFSSYHYGQEFCGNLTANGKNVDIFVPQIYDSIQSVQAVLSTNYSNGYRGIRGQYFVQECGGMFTNVEGEYVSPNYPNNYPQNSYCLWQFIVDWGELIRITFDEFNLGANCEEDYVQIFQGYAPDAPSSGKFCGAQIPPDVHTSTRYATVVFKGKSVQTTEAVRKFKMTVEKTQSGCGGLLFHRYGTFHSPNYPNRYENNVECVWIIKMLVGYHVNFTFVDTFDLETSDDCVKDYLLFEESLSQDEDNWSIIKKYCSHFNPGSLQSKGNIVRVTFSTNQDITGNGFKISYRKSCGEVFTAESGVFTSPNYPNNYDSSISCEYLIQRNPSDYIYLQFESDFHIEHDPTCQYDALNIYRGNNTSATHLGPYCGDRTPLPLISNAAILVTFRTDSYLNAKGFKAFYNITSCGGNLTQPFGEFHSPSHPTQYLHYMNCIWTITVSENRVIELSFIWLQLESCWRCSCDFVEVRDGDNNTSNLLGRYCTGDVPIIKSHRNKLWVRFRSDASVTHNGFKIGYRETLGEAQGCGGVYNNVTNGVIQSPDIDNDGKYESEIDCQWTIIAAADQTVNLTFQEIDIEQSPANMTTCSFDYIEVRDGIEGLSPVIDRFCGTTLPSPIIAGANQLTISFHSDERGMRKGFKLAFEIINSICGGYLNVTNVTQTISSFNYPNAYPVSLRCTWNFYMPRLWDNRIHLVFNDIDIDCDHNDTITLTSGTSYNKIDPYSVCGNKAHHIMSDSGLKMTFISNSRPVNNHRGFSLNYTISNCNMTFEFDSGYLHSASYPYYSYENFCQINITAEIGHTISLYFNNFKFNQYSSSIGCFRSNMTVRDGVLPNSPLIATLCGTALPDPIFSQSNQLSINITNLYYWGYKYFLSYTTTNAGRGCGGNLTAFDAMFTSPLYPQAYNESGECKWFIHSLGLHTLSLRFSVFSLSSALGCDTNYLEIYDGLEELSSNKIIRLCGNDETGQYRSQGNVMMVKLVTNENNTSPGFIAHYTYNSIEINPSKQIITSSLRPHIGRDGYSYYYQNGIMLRNRNNN